MFKIGQHVQIRRDMTREELDAYGLPHYFSAGDVCIIRAVLPIGHTRYRANKNGSVGAWIFREEFFEPLRIACMFGVEE